MWIMTTTGLPEGPTYMIKSTVKYLEIYLRWKMLY